jgi:sec-independent protein translocase protein TatB
MSGVGFSELLILFLIGLIVLGPEKLPRVANQLGAWLGQARRMTRVMKRQLEDELSLEEKKSVRSKASVSTPAYVTPANETDDSWSPQHGPDEPGVGVGVNVDDKGPETNAVGAGANGDGEESETNAVAADTQNLQDDVESAMPNTEAAKKEKVL